jgi:hypothetical protein
MVKSADPSSIEIPPQGFSGNIGKLLRYSLIGFLISCGIAFFHMQCLAFAFWPSVVAVLVDMLFVCPCVLGLVQSIRLGSRSFSLKKHEQYVVIQEKDLLGSRSYFFRTDNIQLVFVGPTRWTIGRRFACCVYMILKDRSAYSFLFQCSEALQTEVVQAVCQVLELNCKADYVRGKIAKLDSKVVFERRQGSWTFEACPLKRRDDAIQCCIAVFAFFAAFFFLVFACVFLKSDLVVRCLAILVSTSLVIVSCLISYFSACRYFSSYRIDYSQGNLLIECFRPWRCQSSRLDLSSIMDVSIVPSAVPRDSVGRTFVLKIIHHGQRILLLDGFDKADIEVLRAELSSLSLPN